MNINPKIFIGSSVEGLEFADAIQQNLEYVADTTIWNQGIFSLSGNTLDDLLNSLNEYDYGVFIFKPDDRSTIREEEYNTIRDNVIFELGLYFGKLGRKKVFYLIPRNYPKLHLPTDLGGITAGTYDYARLQRDSNIQAIVGPFCTEVKKSLKSIPFTKRVGIKQSDFFNRFTEEFEKMIVDSNKISVFFIHSRQWRENNQTAIKTFLKRENTQLIVFLPNFLNEALINKIVNNFSDGNVILTLIKDAYRFFINLKNDLKANVEIRCFDFYPTYSFYCFDEEAIIAMYPTTDKKKNVPAFKILKDSKFWDFVEDDIVELTKNSKKITKKIIEQLK